MRATNKGTLYLAVLSIVWGASFLLIKIAGESIPPIAFAAARMAIGAACLFLFLCARGERMPRLGKAWFPFLVLGMFNALVPATFLAGAEAQISSGLTSVLNSTVPIMTVILAHFLADERLTADKAIGIAVGFVGVVVVLLPDLQGGMKANAAGPTLVLLASLLIALTAVYARKYLRGVEPAKTATGMMATAAFVGLPSALMFEDVSKIRPSTESVLALVALGVFCSAAAFLLYYWLISNRGATYASLVMFAQPPLAIVFAAIFMGTVVAPTTIVGMAIILLCIAIMDGFFDALFGKTAAAPRG